MYMIDVNVTNPDADHDEAYDTPLRNTHDALQQRVYERFAAEHGETTRDDFLKTSMRKKPMAFILSDVLSDGPLTTSLRKILCAELKSYYKDEAFASVGDEFLRWKPSADPIFATNTGAKNKKLLTWTDLTYVFFEWCRICWNTENENDLWKGIYQTAKEIDAMWKS